MFVLSLLTIAFYYLFSYIAGAWCLFLQIKTKHNVSKDIPNQAGKVAIVTGGALGIGYYISKGLVSKSVHVFIGAKCKQTAMAAIDRIHEDFPNAKIDFIQLDLASLQSVKSFAEEFLSRDLPLHILINNAGIMMPPYEETVDGFESQFQVNFLSHFYLTQLLLAKLTQSGKDERWSRIVNVSSYMHRIGRPYITKLGQRAQAWFEYSSHKAYADSKLLIVAATLALHHQLRASGAPVSASAIHPGIVTSGLWRHLTWVHRKPISLLGKYIFLTPEQGAVTALFSALSPVLEGKSGCYYDKSANTIPASLTQDEQFQTEVWSKSLSLIDSCVQSSE